jgi:hypothetical protein
VRQWLVVKGLIGILEFHDIAMEYDMDREAVGPIACSQRQSHRDSRAVEISCHAVLDPNSHCMITPIRR